MIHNFVSLSGNMGDSANSVNSWEVPLRQITEDVGISRVDVSATVT